MPESIDETWDRLEFWLSTHAPETRAMLKDGASPSDIAQAEERMGVKLPDSLNLSFLRHDGSDQYPILHDGFVLLSVEEMVSAWEANVEVMEELANESSGLTSTESDSTAEGWDHEDWVAPPGWDRLYIPFAENGVGDSYVIDMRSKKNDGPISLFSHETGLESPQEAPWGSLAAFMAATESAYHSTTNPAASVEIPSGYQLIPIAQNGRIEWIDSKITAELALRMIFFDSPDHLGPVFDRYFAPTYKQRTDGLWEDRESVIGHITQVRNIIDSGSVNSLDEIVDFRKRAERLNMLFVMRDGQHIAKEVFLFLEYDDEDRICRIEGTPMWSVLE